MPLSKQQVDTLLTMVVNSTADTITCDGCFVDVARFAEAELVGATLCESMELVKNHLHNCPCCTDEYEALLIALSDTNEI